MLAVKGALVGLLVAGAYVHDYVLGPGSRGRSARASGSRCAAILTASGVRTSR